MTSNILDHTFSRFNSGSKLIEKYISHWGNWHAGIFIELTETAEATEITSEESLINHLRSLLLVEMPEDGEVHYRFQETRKLAGILKALDSKERLSELLGPIKRLLWQQNCGADKTYFQVENPQQQETTEKPMGWFNFTQTEKEKIDIAELAWYKRSIVSTVQQKIKEDASNTQHLQKYKPEEIEKFLDNGYDAAHRKNIRSEEGLRFFLINTLYYPEFMNSKEIARIAAQNLWLEPKKINLIRTQLNDYLQKRLTQADETSQKKGKV